MNTITKRINQIITIITKYRKSRKISGTNLNDTFNDKCVTKLYIQDAEGLLVNTFKDINDDPGFNPFIDIYVERLKDDKFGFVVNDKTFPINFKFGHKDNYTDVHQLIADATVELFYLIQEE